MSAETFFFIFFWDLNAKVLTSLLYSLSNVSEHELKAKDFSQLRV